jgi:glycosyltransferase involved in cell wall biosynthesis
VKVLLVNKFYYLSGGAERYVFTWEKLLRAHGHEVQVFSMSHPDNRPCPQADFFVDRVSFTEAAPPLRRVGAAARSIWSREAARKLDALLEAQGKPDVAHVHAFVYQLTPSIFAPLARRGVPIVQTCHEYAHICVNQRLYEQRTNTICEACVKGSFLAPLWKRCIKGSFAASAAGCLAGRVDALFGRSRTHIARFITPSAFMRQEMIAAGMDAQKIVHIPHPIEARDITPSASQGDAMLFVGRLVPQKGIRTFLDAATSNPDIPCRIVGDGPLTEAIRRQTAQAGFEHVAFVGRLQEEALWNEMRTARAVVVPSEWYEPFGLVIVEAMAAARAVIATNIAGPAEIVEAGRTGLLVPPRDPGALAAAMRRLWERPDEAARFGRAGREAVARDNAPEAHYRAVMAQFDEVLG